MSFDALKFIFWNPEIEANDIRISTLIFNFISLRLRNAKFK